MNINERLKELGIELPNPPAKGGVYTPAKEFGKGFIYVSGCVPNINGEKRYEGKVGADLTLEQGQDAARICLLNILSLLREKCGDLNNITRFVKNLTFVASSPDFYSHPQVANGASQLLVDIFGDEVGCPARSAVGVAALPGNVPVEIEMLVEIK